MHISKISLIFAIITLCFSANGQITFNGNSSYTYTAVGGPAPSCSPGEIYYNGDPVDGIFSTSGNCMTLTDGSTGSNEGMWVGVCDALDLTNDFVLCFEADFGSNAASGDGIAFVLNGTGTIAPFPGEGGFIGYGQNTGDVVAVEFDSFADGDIGCHHSEINYQGINGTNLSTPIPLETCCGDIIGTGSQDICIYWEVSSGTTGTLTAVYDGQIVAEFTGDLGALVGTNPTWGFTAGGNSSGQVQTVCNANMENLASTNGAPVFTCDYIPATDFSATPDPATLCEGDCLNIALSGPPGSSFCWVADDNIHVNGESLTVQTGSTINDCPVNDDFGAGGAPPSWPDDQVITYTVSPSAGGCVGESFQVTATLLDELNPACTCASPNLLLDALFIGSACTPATIDLNDAVDIASDLAGNNLTFYDNLTDAQNGTNAIVSTVSVSGTYYIRLELGSDPSCYSIESVIITFYTTPTITNNPLTDDICSGESANFALTADVLGTTFTWTATGSSGDVS